MEINELLESHGKKLYNFCLRFTNSKEEADDLYQDTFLTAMEHIEQIDKEENPGSYLVGIALRIQKNNWRKVARRQRIAPTKEWEEDKDTEERYMEYSVEDKILQKELISQVRMTIEKLPQKYQIILYLAFTMELSGKEMANVLHLPEGTVKSRLHKAKKLFQKSWEADSNEQRQTHRTIIANGSTGK